MKLETVWAVREPLAHETTANDLAWRTTPPNLVSEILGDHLTCGEHASLFAQLTLYTTEAEARADAMDRIRARDTKAATALANQVSYGLTNSGYSPKCSAETVTPGHVRVTVHERLDADRVDNVAQWLAPIEAPSLTVDIVCGGYSVRVHGGEWSPIPNEVKP